MDFYMKLPRNKREFALFMGVISIISVNIIAPLITCFETDFSLTTWANVLHILPAIWLSVVAVVLATYVPAERMTGKIVAQEDSFNAHIIVNILCTVLMMSVILTVVGTWIGTGAVTMEPIQQFFYKWPRNFAVSLFVEMCIVQPVARFVMLRLHQFADRRVHA